jgi:hypothetical protein
MTCFVHDCVDVDDLMWITVLMLLTLCWCVGVLVRCVDQFILFM